MGIIEITKLTKKFQINGKTVVALDNVNLSIEKGEIFGIIGMSGAGKSTLVRTINYLERPTEGDVSVYGVALSELGDRELRKMRSKIGMIFQGFNLLEQRNVLGNVCFPMELAGVKRRDARKKALDLLKLVKLEDKEAAYPSQLSGGQKQRVAIARALATNPSILLCDEATSALDPQTTSAILKLLKEINKQLNITIVIITHQMSVVTEICDKVAIMYAGEIIESGSAEDIFEGEFHHPYTVGLFGSIPDLTVKTARLNPIDGLMPDPANLPEGCKFNPRCPHCQDICKKEVPGTYEKGGHRIKCHLYANKTATGEE